MIKNACKYGILAIFLGGGAGPAHSERYRLGGEEGTAVASETESTLPEMNDVIDEFTAKGLQALKDGDLETAEGYFDRVLILNPRHREARDGINLIMKMVEESTRMEEKDAKKQKSKMEVVRQLKERLDRAVKLEDWKKADTLAEQIIAVHPEDKTVKTIRRQSRRKLFLLYSERAKVYEKQGNLTHAIDAYQTALQYRSDPSLRSRIEEIKIDIFDKNKNAAEDLYIEALAEVQKGETARAASLCRRALSLNPDHIEAQKMMKRLNSMQMR